MEEGDRQRGQIIEVHMPTYIMHPEEDEKFLPAAVKAIAEQVLQEELGGKEYDEDEAKEWSLNVCENIKTRVKDLNIPRYKIVVQATIGELRDQGVRVASRSLWDTATDNYASCSFRNQTLWCVVIVFGVYTE
mmetsp:Transcript_8485/g.17012  ORF Transcript_8485/g.17012 Transcript_8485/m.17012 type:complete len:133 (+) Transcript_8485:36-434(+)